jgi:transketolase C-terminal domain/subunit
MFYRIGLKDRFSSIVGSQDYLRNQYQMDAAQIALKVSELLKSKH